MKQLLMSLALLSLAGLSYGQEKGISDTDSLSKFSETSYNSKKLFYDKLELFNKGKLNPPEQKELADLAKSLDEKEVEQKIAAYYINNYLFKINEKELLTKDNLIFIGKHLDNPDSKAFKFFKNHSDKVNAVLGNYIAQMSIMNFINANYLPKGDYTMIKKPDWDSIEKMVITKFGSLGEEIVWGQRMLYHGMVKDDWRSFGKYYMLYFERSLKHPPRFVINNITWDVFENIDDPKVIAFGIEVMKYVIETSEQNDAESLDTYANLLYKAGRTREAIEWEEKAVKMKRGAFDEKVYTDILEKMNRGERTW